MKWIDTFRGVGCLFVLFAHIVTNHERFGVYTNGCGKIGVWLFMVLAGYMSLYGQREKQTSVKSVLIFYAKRLVKLYPVFLLGLFLAMAVGLVNDGMDLLRHLFLVEEKVHFWYMAVIIKFYLLVPFIQLFYQRCKSHYVFFTLLFLSCVMLSVFPPSAYQENSILLRWYLPVFLYGMMLYIIQNDRKQIGGGVWWDYIAIAGFFAIIMLTPPARKLFFQIEPSSFLQNKYYLIGLLWCVILFGVSNGRFIKRLFEKSKVIHFLGEISFPVYIFHYEILHGLLRFQLNFWTVLGITLVATIILSWLVHRYLEANIMKVFHKKVIRCFIVFLGIGIMLTGCSSQQDRQQLEDSNGITVSDVIITVPGLTEDCDYLFMADNQAVFEEREDLGWFGTYENRTFRDEKGISSAQKFDSFIRYANESGVKGLLLGGDIIDYYSEKNVSVLKQKLSKLEIPYLYGYGNHDSYVPWENEFVDHDSAFLDLFDGDDCEFQMIECEDYHIVSVRNYQPDGTAQISDYALERFKEVYDAGKPIVLICHVPIYTSYTEGLFETATDVYGTAFKEYDAGSFGTVNESLLMGEDCGYELSKASRDFLELVLAKDSPVVGILSGHLHKEWSGMVNEHIPEYVVSGAFTGQCARIHLVKENGNDFTE